MIEFTWMYRNAAHTCEFTCFDNIRVKMNDWFMASKKKIVYLTYDDVNYLLVDWFAAWKKHYITCDEFTSLKT